MKRKNLSIIILIFGIVSVFFGCKKDWNPLHAETGDGIIDADDPGIQYVGRFDRSDSKKAVFDWSGVIIRAAFEGTSCSIRLKDGSNLYAVSIDGATPTVLQTDTSTVYPVATGLADSVHTIMIQKRTEAFVGKGEFLGFILDEGKDLATSSPAPDRRIEFIGNSITCAYGVEGASASSPFTPQTENAAKSFAAMLGRALNADYQMVCYSGKGVVRNYGDANQTSPDPMPSLYGRTLCADAQPVWDYTSWIPQVVVINLGTNDYSTQPYPDKAVFQNAYQELIGRVQSQYPFVTIFCICGPMIGSPCSTYIKEAVEQCRQNNENKEVYYIEVPTSTLTMADRGSDWHPNIKGQQKTADIILPVIQNTMNW